MRRGSVTVAVVVVGGAVALACFAWWVTGLAAFAARTAAVVLAAGVAAMAAGRWSATRWPPRRAAGAARAAVAWVAVALALAAWELAAYVQRPRRDHPTLSSLADAALDPRPLRAAAFAAWLAGAAVLAR